MRLIIEEMLEKKTIQDKRLLDGFEIGELDNFKKYYFEIGFDREYEFRNIPEINKFYYEVKEFLNRYYYDFLIFCIRNNVDTGDKTVINYIYKCLVAYTDKVREANDNFDDYWQAYCEMCDFSRYI